MEKKNAMVRDMTQGSVLTTLVSFAAPMMLANLLQIVYNMVDMMVIGQFVGQTGLSAVSCGGEITSMITCFIFGFCSAGQVLISQYLGRGDREGMSRVVGSLLSFLALTSIAVTVIGLAFMEPLMSFINVPQEAEQDAIAYASCCFYGVIFIFEYNAVSAILRGIGDSKHPLVFIAIAAVTNLILDLLFVAVFNMGPFGAALATVIGQAVSFIISVIFLYKRKEEFGFDFGIKSFKIDGGILKMLLKLGVPVGLQQGAVMISKAYVHSFINAYGVTASAVNAVGNKIGQCAMVVSNAFSSAGMSMIGQNFSAGKQDRVKKVVYLCFAVGLAYSAVLCAVMIIWPEQIFGLFNNEEAVLEMCHSYVLIACLQFIGFAVRAPMQAIIHGTGASTLSLLMGIFDGIVARIGLSLLFGIALDMGIMGFWLGDVCASQVPLLVGGTYFWGGFWKKHKVIVAEK